MIDMRCNKIDGSALGQKRTSEHVQSMSALPPKADIAEFKEHVYFVPIDFGPFERPVQ
jgi:hypothetical protein